MTTPNAKLKLSSAVAIGCLSIGALGLSTGAQADTEYRVGGYIKADFMASRFSDGSLPSGSIGRDFYIPGLTPIGGESNTVTDFHARESRFFAEATQTLSNGESIRGYLEIDFLATPGGDSRITNSYSPRLRHAYIGYGNWLVGQTWSNFQEVAIIPEAPDFVGVADGIVFNRQVQARYTFDNGLSLSVEAPETTVTPYQAGNGRVTTGDTAMPDFTARYAQQHGDIYYSIAGIVRRLEYNNGAGIDDTEMGYGASLALKWNIGPHDIRTSVVHGPGLGRYVGLNLANGAVVDEDLNLDAIDVTGFSFAYRHVWSEKYRTNFIYSRADVDNDAQLAGIDANDDTQRFAANLMYQVNERMVVGVELSRATRTLLSGDDGDLDRLQVSAQYAF
ncbi:DcaP family trimeric outer membrane transporter [Aliidiomarina sp. Khilg15.8]